MWLTLVESGTLHRAERASSRTHWHSYDCLCLLRLSCQYHRNDSRLHVTASPLASILRQSAAEALAQRFQSILTGTWDVL
jgi:hypothetical protein